jgi:hypothetical protein
MFNLKFFVSRFARWGAVTIVAIVGLVAAGATAAGPVARNECANPPAGAVLCEDFENSGWRSTWGSSTFSDVTDLTNPGPSGDSANKAIQFMPAAGVSSHVSIYKSFPPAQRMWARWYTQYNAGFNFSDRNHGGGFSAGDISKISSSGNRPAGDSTGFASFWTEYHPATGKFFTYSYYHGMYQDCPRPGSCFGDGFPCVYDGSGPPFYCTQDWDRPIGGMAAVPTPVANRWYCVEQMLDVGDPVPDANAGQANGEFRSYIDGVLVAQIPNLHVRTSSGFQGPSEIFLMLFFHEASHNNAGQMFDNIVISPSRIGCGTSTPDVRSPILTNAGPTGNVASPVSLSVTSDKACVAKFSTAQRPYGYAAAQTTFLATGGMSHLASVPLGIGTTREYFQCADAAGNISNMPAVTFSVTSIGGGQLPAPANLRVQ